MVALVFSRSALRVLITRAMVLWALLRALVTAVMLMASTSGGADDRIAGPRPLAVVVLCALLGMLDVKRRHETALWINLGISMAQVALLFAIAAGVGETLLALVRP
jgi:ABC-type nitrate/sulfonate/bicarbonate transport system permease component